MTTSTDEKVGIEAVSRDELDYLLLDMELLMNAEYNIRGRIEQVGQFFLTSLTAIGGGSLLLWQIAGGDLRSGSAILLFASLFAGGMGLFMFLRYVTYLRSVATLSSASMRIRVYLYSSVVKYLGGWEDYRPNTAGYSAFYAISLALFCGFCFALALVAGIAIVMLMSGKPVLVSNKEYAILYGLPATLTFASVVSPLLIIVRNTLEFFDRTMSAIEPPKDFLKGQAEKSDTLAVESS